MRADSASSHHKRRVARLLSGKRLFVEALATLFQSAKVVLAFSLAFYGIPLPPLPQRIPQAIRKPLELVRHAVGPQEAQAASFKDTQAASASMSGTVKSASAAITAVDTTKSLMVLTANGGSAAQSALTKVEFASPTELYLSRAETGSTNSYQWYVAEFQGSEIFTQQGLTQMPTGATSGSRNVSLPFTVDLSKAFCLFYISAPAPSNSSNVFVHGALTNSNTISFTRYQHTNAVEVTIAYQVVEFQSDATVQRGNVTLSGGALTGTATLSPAINPNKAFVVVSQKTLGLGGGFSDSMVSAEITDGTTLTFTRRNGSNDVTLHWQVVEFTDATTVQKGTIANTTSKTPSATISSVDTTRAFPFYNANSGDATTTDADNHMLAATLGATSLSFSRSGMSATDIAWFVVELPIVKVTSPNGGELWKVGETKNITWTHAKAAEAGGSCGGTNHAFKIELCQDGATCASPLLITGSVCGNLDTYAWTIPETISATNVIGATSRIKITDTNATTSNYDVSNANFEIKGSLSLTAPDGGELWFVGDTTRNITWNYTGALGTVTLKYDTASGTGGYTGTIATGISVGTGGLGSYNWNPGGTGLPDLPYNTMRVKVTADSDAAVADSSAADFTIRPKITVTAPNAGTEVWKAQTTENVTWTQTGTIPQVNVYYSTNTGVDWTAITTSYAGGSPYAWLVPVAAIGNQTKVKVEKTGDSAVFDTAPDGGTGVFEVKPSLKITSPNDGTEIWRVGESRSITWQLNGSITTADLQYSTNGGSTYTNIATGISATSLTYSWTIPDAVTDQGRVKIKHPTDVNIFDESDNNFKIRGRLTVTAPNGGEVWTVGSSRVITWTRDGTWLPDTNVDILYSTNGGTSYPNMLATNVTGLSWTWNPIPDVIGNTVRVRVRATASAYTGDTFDDSDANFSIKASLTVTAPNGGEVWGAVTSQTITWDKTGTLTSVKLEYSSDGGATYPNTIIASTPADTDPPTGANNGQYAWTTPAQTGTQFRVRVTNIDDTTVLDASNTNFTLKGSLTVNIPNGGETWVVGDSKNITWTEFGGIANVKLEYSTNAFADELQTYTIAASLSAAAGAYAWTIPDAIGANLKVRITDAGDATVSDVSNSPFTIKGSVVLTRPNGAETFIVGATENINWTMTGTLGNVKLEYSTNGFADELQTVVITASTPADSAPTGDNAGSYPWTVADAIGGTAKVRVTQLSDGTVKDASDLDFTIKGSLTITAPNGSEQWSINDSRNITWTKTGTLTGSLKLEYSTDGGLTYPVGNLISNTVAAAATSYAWTVPDNPTTQARVRVTYLNDTSVNDQSDANFSIKGSLFIQAPNGGETWNVGESRNITWTKGGAISNAKLDYSIDGGTTYPNAIVASTPAANLSYAWTIPDSISTSVRVRITDVADSTVADASNANFTIKPTLTLTAPNGGQTWIVNDVQNVTWTKTGTIANVKIEYSTNAFADELQTFTIVASTPGANLSYAWTIPDAIGTNVKVRATNLADTTVADVSDAAFSIKGSLALTSPNGGETWIVNESRNVTWTKQGSIANVKLEYSKNGFLDELQTFTIIASTAAAPLSYAWTVADAIGANVKVRVTDASDGTVSDVSNAAFTIKGKLALTAPNGGETWTVLSSQNVTWTRDGSITNVKLEYSTDGGSTFPNTITTSTDAAAGSYAWTIPDAIGDLLKVRVTNTADTTVFDDSNANFKIRGALTLTAPNGGEKWTVGTGQNLTWTRTGSIANVKLEYSPNAFADELQTTVITASTPADPAPADNAGSFAWTVPNSPSATVKVRVSDVTDAAILDLSNGAFKIKAGLTLSAPNGGEVWTVGSAQTISWTTVGTAANVKLEYSTDGGTTYPNVISASTTNTGSYAWTVPDAIATSVRVKVTDVADTDAVDASDANFKIRGALTLTAPNGGEGWQINTSQNIAWTRTGSIANVKIEYSTNAFADELQTTVITASTPADPLPADNAGTYAWTIPDNPSATVKVRVSDALDATVSDLSNAAFSIKGSFTLTAPDGSEVWVVGATQNIVWNVFGAIASAKLQYSTDGGATWPVGNVITASTPASTDPPTGAGNGQYAWTVPDAIGSQLRVRVSDAADATVFDDSNANFTIKGSIQVAAPNGGEVWIVGNSNNITWTKTGSFANVKLEYSTNGFTDELQNVSIVTSTPNDGLYAWTVPDAIGTTLKVRASDVADSSVVDASNANFEIKGSLTLSAPNGTEVWRVSESRNITWTKTGTIANVKLEYSTNGGTTYPNVITASTDATTGTYAWTVPDAIGTQVRVKITHTGDAAVNDASNANFEIKGSVTLTSPNGSEVWTVGSSQNITWTRTGSFANVKIEYSTNAFADELQTTVITASTAADPLPTDNAGTYAWTVPDAIGSSLRVRIGDAADSATVDTSNANFKIVGSLTLTAPNGGQSWTVGSGQFVTWTKVGSIANVKIEYSTDSGTSYPNIIIASTAAGTGAYSWTIPDSMGTTRRVKVSDASDSTVFDASDADFTIMGGFTISAPNGGEVWTVGSAQTISWTTAGSVTNVKLEYSTDGGSTFPNTIIATTTNTGSYAWTVPDSVSTLVKVRVSDVNNANALDVSNGNFKIRGALTLNAPNGGEAWQINTTQSIAWSRVGSIANVKLEYSTNAFADELQTSVITASTAADPLPADNAGTYSWPIPDAPGTTIKVRVSDASDSTVFDLSNATFSIKGSFTLTAPDGSEVWVVGATQNVIWDVFGAIANAKLQYSTDGGATWPAGNVIVASTPASTDPPTGAGNGQYSWTVPDAIGSQLRVRVSDANDATVFDDSNANFTIKGSVTLTAPNGAEVWIVGASQSITWSKAGSFANVKLEYSTNSGSTYPNLITASTPNTGTYTWTLPDIIGTTNRVRVSDAADSSVVDASNADFTVKGKLLLNAPNGGETWVVGASQNITWTRTGSIANVKLEYSTDGGITYPNTITASTTAASGSYAWTIPDAIGTALRVRVTDASDATVSDVSDANFAVKGSVTLTAPNGGEAWVVGTSYNVSWTKTGTFATVKLEYSTNGFADELQTVVITTSTDAALGTYSWVIPDNLSSTVKVRVGSNSDATVQDISNANFKIVGSLTLTAPNGGEKWTVGSSRSITWTRTGSIANAKLEYSIDGGTAYPNVIVASTPAASLSYLWTIPDALSTTTRVKILDASDASVFDVSNANFKIQAVMTVTAPNGGETWTVNNSQNITWTSVGSVQNVKIEYSTNAFADELQTTVITASTPSTGTYAWTVPDAISATVKVRVTDANDAEALDVSDAAFKIAGSLALTAPNGGEKWAVGSSKTITWTYVGSLSTVKLEYSTNGGTTYPNLIVASTPVGSLGSGSYAWTLPDAPTTTAKVRVVNTADSAVFDESDANFKIQGSITLTAPNGAEVWRVGESRDITWNKAGSFANVKLEYSTNGGTTYPNVIVASTPAGVASGSYAWTLPDAIGTQLRVRASDAADSEVVDTSNADFEIKGTIAVTAPNGGEVWVVGGSQNIAWTKAGSFANVKLEYSKNGFADELQTFSIVASTPSGTPANSGSYAWTIPDAIGATLKVRASDAADSANVKDVSDANFEIKGSVALTSPNGGEIWVVGNVNNITWTKTGTITNVKLEYSTNGGATYPNTITLSTSAANLSYAWTVPDAIGTQVRVRITHAADATVTDASNANFEIKGSLTLTAPNGGEAWVVGSSQNITWTKTGSIANTKLEYSTDGGTTYPVGNVINSLVDASLGTYAWTIPDNLSSTVKVRITNNADATVTDASDANFKIVGSFTLTAPNGMEKWKVGTGQAITWTKVGSIANAKLEYSTNGGTTYPNVIIVSTPASNLAYTWTIPDSPSTTVKVRLSDTGDPSVNDVSDANFSILAGFTLTAPAGGEVWTVASSQNITWTTTGSVANVKLEYSTDGGTTYPNVISASALNTGSFAWTIPDNITSTAKVKISDVNNGDAFDVSDTNFKIRGSLTVTAPNGGETWPVAVSQNIGWTRVGSIADVKLEYSTDGGLTYPNLIIASTAADPLPADDAGAYAWTVPDAISSSARVRVTNVADSTVFDTSDANFSIKGSFTLAAPNGGETWIVGDTQNITWTKTGSIANAKLEYSTNGGLSYPNVIVLSTGAGALVYNWSIPDAIGAQMRVKITDAADATVFDTSNTDFTIKGSLTLTAPNGGETWVVGSSQNITWTKTGSIANVKLEYSKNGFSDELQTVEITASTLASSLSYAWTIPDAIGTNLKVRVTNTADATVADVSNAAFKIAGSLTITAPNGGEVWVVGSSQAITWSKTGTIANVKLLYSTDGGVTYPDPTNVIVASTPAINGSYAWTIPDAITTTAKIKVVNVDDATVSDVSDANFKIAGSFTLTAPNGGEVLGISSSYTITWTKTGSIANAKLEYSTNSGTTYPNLIVASTPAANLSYAWTVPDTATTTGRVKISDVGDATVFDTSNNDFVIKVSITVTSPNGGETWVVGESRNITWTNIGTLPNVKLDYSVDGGTSFPNLIVASTPNSNSYAWVIPDAIGTQLRVRVSDASNASAFDASDANFTVKGSFTLTAPNGGEEWVVGNVNNITWTKTGSIANAKLEYSKNGFADELQTFLIVGSTPAANLNFAWTIPDALSATVKVRLTDVNDGSVVDVSNANFKIKGALSLTAPNGGEQWAVASTQSIIWTRAGSVANAKLEYSTNGGTTYPNVISTSTPASALSYSWVIPDTITTSARVRITDTSDASVTDASDANFKIMGSFTLTAPNGGEVWVVGESRNITWTKTGSIANAKLEYSVDGGLTFPIAGLITSSVPANLGTYAWVIPDTITLTARVRISDAADASVLDISDANFKIAGKFTLTAPNGGETLTVGQSYSITWTRTGSIANAKLEYSINGGATYPNVIVGNTPAANLVYAWTVPDAIGTQLRVRITDLADATVLDTSDANFKIKAGFTLTAPNGGEVWVVGTTQNVAWTWTGAVANAKLDYSIDGGATYPNVITASTPNTGTYAWVIPDALGTTLRVQVTDVLDAAAFDTSDANFKIKGALTLSAPNGGEVWIVQESRTISWTRTGSIANVKLEYSTDGGTTYPVGNLIVTSTPADPLPADNAGSYAWTVPDAIGVTTKVRVTDVTDATVADASNANFTIRGGFTVTAPNGGEKWTVGSTQPITWTTFGTIPNVKLDYSTDGGSTFPAGNVIIASTANTGSYNWTILNAISPNVRVRVSSTVDTGSFDMSNADFKIMGGFAITAPNGGEVWVVGTSRNITWTTAGTVANVKLEYSTDGGATYPVGNLITASTPNTGTFSWAVADAISATLRVRVSDATDADATDASDANFKIRSGFTVTTPNGGERWVVGEARTIAWTTAGTVSNVKIDYSRNGFADELQTTVLAASAANTGSFAWTIPDTISNAVKVRVADVNDSTASDTSDTNFKIEGKLTVTAPNGGEKWTVGSTRTITWDRVGSIANAKLDASTNGGTSYFAVVASTPNTGSYAWTIPDAQSANGLVKVSDASDPDVFDTSNGAFKILASFALTAPNGGEAWLVGSSQNITWTTNGSVGLVKLEYSTDSGATWPAGKVIVASTSNLGTYAWTIPDDVSTTVRIRVSNAADAEAFDTSNSDFRIRSIFTITQPNGAQQWIVGNVENITWATTGTIPNVKLQFYTLANAGDIQTITASIANSGTYAWTIPDVISSTVKVRVSDPNDPNAYDDSNADFKIVGGFTITAPDGGELWGVGENRNITWNKTGTVPNVKIEYSTNGGIDYPNVISALATNSGSYPWTVPDTITATAKVKVSDAADTTAFDVSNADFKIKANFTLSGPNGGEIWEVADNHPITWTNTGTVPNVKLTYSTDSGTSYPNTIAASTSNTGAYTWSVPDAIATTVRVKVESTTDAEAFDASNADFKIRGKISVTAPNGLNEPLPIASTYPISWLVVGTIPNLKITYSTDGGLTYPNLVTASTPSSPQTFYNWVVPDTPSTQGRVKIEDPNDAAVFDASDNDFRIHGNFTITAPNGGEVWKVGEARSITWNWGGTMPTVKLTYSTDGGVTFPNIIAASAPNGTGGSGSFSYAWTVPDAITATPTAKVRIESASDGSVFDVSNAGFKIVAGFTVTAPNGDPDGAGPLSGERWITNESRTISWTAVGTVPTVKLEYSTDGGLTWPAGNLITASVANTGSYVWTVADNRSATARVRVLDTRDLSVFDASDADFKIDYYTVTWELKDLLTNKHLDQLAVSQPAAANGTGAWSQTAMSSPVVHDTPYGVWQATWKRTGYGDLAKDYTADMDKTITEFMETLVVHIYDAATEVSYDPPSNTLVTDSVMKRDGSVMTGAVECTVEIYDAGTLIKTLGPMNASSNPSGPDVRGFFRQTWTNTTLQGGKTYQVITTISIATGAVFKTPRTFQITAEKKLFDIQQDVRDELKTQLGFTDADIAAGKSMKSELAAQTDFIKGSLGFTDQDIQQGKSLKKTLDDFSGSVASSIISLEGAAQQSESAAKNLESVGLAQSARLLVPAEATTGLPLVIQWRGPKEGVSGLAPKITLENANSEVLVSAIAMKPVSGSTGLYEYQIDVVDARDYTPGRNIIVSVETPMTSDASGETVTSLVTETIFVKRPEGRLLLRDTARAGETVKIQLVGAENWTPVIELFHNGVRLAGPSSMRRASTDGKVTTFDFEVPKAVGDLVPLGAAVTTIVSEPLTGFFDQGTFSFSATSLDDLSGQIAAASTSKAVIQDTYDAVRNLQGSFDNDGSLGQKLEVVKQKIDRLPRAISEEGGTVRMRQAIADVAERINTLAGTEGYDFSQLMELGVEKGLEKAESIKDIRKKTDAVQGTTELMQVLMENKLGGLDAPVVHVIYE